MASADIGRDAFDDSSTPRMKPPIRISAELRVVATPGIVGRLEQPERSLTLWTGYIVDRFSGLFLVPFAPARPGRRERAQRFGAAIDASQRDIGEGDDPVAALGLGDADGLADQCLAEKDEVAAPADLAIRAHAADGVCGIVMRLFQAPGIA